MRSTLPQCARLVVGVMLTAACRGPASVQAHGQVTVNITVTCAPNQITFAIDSSSVIIHHTGLGKPPTDIDWALDGNSSVTSVSIMPEVATAWPLNGNPPFTPNKSNPYHGVGKGTQSRGHYRYSVTATCPGPGGPTGIFDPDIWVD